ncbi:MAG: histidine kinase dimerization/phospho-acceptor domain-containing protein, partial [Planctomycetaceae bacterium]
MRASTFWSFLLLFVAVFLPGMLAVLTSTGRLTTAPAPSLPVVVTLLGLVAVGVAGLANLQIARQTARNLGAVCQALRQASQGEVSSRIPHSERSHVEPVAAAVDQLQDFLRSHFAEVQSSRDQLSLVLNSMVEGVLVVDEQQRVVLLNESAYRLFRLPQGADGRLLFELVRNPQLLLWVTRVLEDRQTVGGEVELLSNPPRVLNLRVLALPRGGSRGAVMVVATDISQLRKLERVRQEFVANASHELKTPLASIKACVETLLEGGAIDDPQFRDRFLGMAAEQADRLDKLVRDLLSLTRIESEGQRDVEPVAIDR